MKTYRSEGPELDPSHRPVAFDAFPAALGAAERFLAGDGASSIPVAASTGRRLDFRYSGISGSGVPGPVFVLVGSCAGVGPDGSCVDSWRIRDPSTVSTHFATQYAHYRQGGPPVEDFFLSVGSGERGHIYLAMDVLSGYEGTRFGFLGTRTARGNADYRHWRSSAPLDDETAARAVVAILESRARGASPDEIAHAADAALAPASAFGVAA